jgi:hypothetical protein
MSVEQEELDSRFLNEKEQGQTGRWRLDAGNAVMCDHRRWGIRDCRKARHRCQQCVLQIGSGRAIPVVKDAQVGSGRTIPVVTEALRGLTLRQLALNIWVFVGDVREDFILGLGTPRAYHVTVDVGCHGLLPTRMWCQWEKSLQRRCQCCRGLRRAIGTGGSCVGNAMERVISGERPKKGAAGQLPNESSPEASDHPHRVQRHLRAKMMAVRVGRRASYLGAARDEQPEGGSSVTCLRFPWL